MGNDRNQRNRHGHRRSDYLDHPASSGRCSIVNEIRVVNDNGDQLPPKERGELQIRGSTVFKGYWDKPEANAEVFTSDGWMKTGDVAYIDDRGISLYRRPNQRLSNTRW